MASRSLPPSASKAGEARSPSSPVVGETNLPPPDKNEDKRKRKRPDDGKRPRRNSKKERQPRPCTCCDFPNFQPNERFPSDADFAWLKQKASAIFPDTVISDVDWFEEEIITHSFFNRPMILYTLVIECAVPFTRGGRSACQRLLRSHQSNDPTKAFESAERMLQHVKDHPNDRHGHFIPIEPSDVGFKDVCSACGGTRRTESGED